MVEPPMPGDRTADPQRDVTQPVPAMVEREYVGLIWIGDDPGIRLSIWAPTGVAAMAKVVELYGEGHVITLTNEANARRPR